MMNEELKQRVAQFVEDERRSCSMDVFSPEYVTRCIYISQEDAEQALRELGEIK